MNLFGIRMPRSNLNAGNRRLHVRARIWMLVMHFLNWMTQIQNPLTEKINRMTRELIWIVIFTARQNPANLNEIKMNLIVKFANLAGKSYIMMCDIPTNPHVGILMYADDIVIYMSGNSTKFIGTKIQEYMNQLNAWFEKWGLKLSLAKTTPMLFTKSIKLHYPTIELNDKPLTFPTSHTFLGVTFDSKLQWHSQIENLTARCKRKLNFLRCLSGTKWGSSTKSLLMVYRSYIRSLLDYGCEAYDSASKSVKKPLDSIQYQALRICTGTLPLTPLTVLQAETGEMPLDLRRQMLSEKLKLSVSRFSDHPLIPQIKNCWQFEYMKTKRCNKPVGYRTIETNSNEIEHQTPPALPPWKVIIPSVSFELKEYINKNRFPTLHVTMQRRANSNKMAHGTPHLHRWLTRSTKRHSLGSILGASFFLQTIQTISPRNFINETRISSNSTSPNVDRPIGFIHGRGRSYLAIRWVVS